MSVMSGCRLIAATIILFLAATASANDGITRFQQDLLPRLPPGMLTYESAAPRGALGFVLEKVVAKVPAQSGMPASTIQARRVVVEELDFDGLAAQTFPHFMKLEMFGLVETGNTALDALRQRYGMPETPPGDFRLDYWFDPWARTFRINRLEGTTPGTGSVSFELALDNLRTLGPIPRAELDAVALRSFRLSVESLSGMQFSLRAIAELLGKTEETMIREWQAAIAVVVLGKNGRTRHFGDALVSFLNDYRQPAGHLRIMILPSKPITMRDLGTAWSDADPAGAIGLDASYPGTKEGAAAAALLPR